MKTDLVLLEEVDDFMQLNSDSPIDEIHWEVLKDTKDSNAKICDGEVGQKEVRNWAKSTR